MGPRPAGGHTLRRGLDAVPDPRHRALVADVLAAGLVDEIIAPTDGFDGTFDRAQARAEVAALEAEFRASGVDCPTAHISHLTLMRALMMPLADNSLSYALSRVWVLATYVDDLVSQGRSETEAILRAGLLTGRSARSPVVDALHRAFDEMGKFADPMFLAVFKSFYYWSTVGVLMEAELTPAVDDDIDTEYVRAASGFCEAWFFMLQFAGPCLRARANWGFWTQVFSSTVAFLIDFNDMLSFYKEAIHGTDFRTGRLYRRCVQEGIPYLDSYRRALDSGMTAYRRILRLADDGQRPHLDRYMRAYIHWHLRSARYRWQALYPSLTPLDIGVLI